jgi:transposase-like protein
MGNIQAEIVALRREVEAIMAKAPRCRRYPDTMKVSAMRLAEQGVRPSDLAKRIGLSPSIVSYWTRYVKVDPKISQQSGHFLPVHVVDPRDVASDSISTISVRTPHGLLVEGFSVAEAVAFVSRLEEVLP